MGAFFSVFSTCWEKVVRAWFRVLVRGWVSIVDQFFLIQFFIAGLWSLSENTHKKEKLAYVDPTETIVKFRGSIWFDQTLTHVLSNKKKH